MYVGVFGIYVSMFTSKEIVSPMPHLINFREPNGADKIADPKRAHWFQQKQQTSASSKTPL